MSTSPVFDSTTRERLIPVHTAYGKFNVWTQRHGTHAEIKVLLLHDGPGWSHEYLEIFDDLLPRSGIEYYYYDQLGAGYSDWPDHPALWDIARYVDEVEQVRRGLGLEAGNFFLLGHGWGGMLALEYALAYPHHLKGLVLSNASANRVNTRKHVRDVLKADMPPHVAAQIDAYEAAGDYTNPHYADLVIEHYYEKHMLRRPYAEWPDPVLRALAHINRDVYIPMRGPSGLADGGKLAQWNREADLARIHTQTLVISGRHDFVSPRQARATVKRLPAGRHCYCSRGSHLAMYDDTNTYISGLVDFLYDAADFAAGR